MTNVLRYTSLALTLAASAAGAQSVPADTGTTVPGIGFTLPRVAGSLNYGVSASEAINNGFYNNNGTSYYTNISGDLAYLSKSARHPFSAVYDGGVLIGNSNQPTTAYQSLAFSQILSTKNWNIAIADSVSYLPQSPVGGLSGIPGTGDLGVDPIAVGPAGGLGILTTYGPRVTNTLSGTLGRQITGKISAQATGDYGIQRFVGDNASYGLDNSTQGGSVGLTYRWSARDTLTGNYNYSKFSYTANTYSFSAQGATVEYSRKWSARLLTDVYAGPQIITGSSTAIAGTAVTVTAGASANYLNRSITYSAAYSRGANNGSGVLPGSIADNLTFAAHKQFGRDWGLSGDVGYSRTSSLPNFTLYKFDSNAVFFGAQGSRRFGRYFSGFLSYTVENQSFSSPATAVVAPNAFSGLYQIVAFGATYSPRSLVFGR